MLSSTTFSPALFLSEVHSNASTQSLLQGLDFLSRSIDQKSASLKALVESNFERFVKAKATIDDVYTEMRSQGELDKSNHARQSSRSSAHFRNASASDAPPSPRKAGHKSLPAESRKNSLTRENEYGVLGIRLPLVEAANRAREVYGPALGGREREESLKAVLASVERYRGVFEASEVIADSIKRKDYEALVEEYGRARRYAEEARECGAKAEQSNLALTDAQIHQIIVTARMWADVEEQIELFKNDIWRRLLEVQSSTNGSTDEAAGGQTDQHLELIGTLLELGTQENPIWAWLLRRFEHLKDKISTTCERLFAEVEFVRRHLANDERPVPHVVASHLRPAEHQDLTEQNRPTDTMIVIELWERIYSSLQLLLASKGSILAEVAEFWVEAQSFIDGRAQKSLPIGFNGQSRKHHRIGSDDARSLQRGATELVALVRDKVHAFFANTPLEDISSLFSPLSPVMPALSGMKPTILSPLGFTDMRFNLDLRSPPPPSPRRGDAWEKFAFWPPYSNSLSGVHYVNKILVLVSNGASDMAAMNSIGQASGNLDRLRVLVGTARERCVQAICAAWGQDAETCKFLEDWKRATDRKETSTMPWHFTAFESDVLSGLQKILYLSEAMSKPSSADVVSPPPAKVLQLVRSQFVASLYKVFSIMVENAERPVTSSAEQWGNGGDGLSSPVTNVAPANLTAQSVNAQDQKVRKLLTLSSLQAMRAEITPQLVTQFENAFSVKLTDESKTIRDVLGQIDARLFQSYARPVVEELGRIIRGGVLAPTWAPKGGRPSEVRPYIYTAMLALVLVHSQVSTTAPSLTGQIMSYLLEQTSLALLDAFRQRPKYTLAALMQATLDVEFVTQTLSQYTTAKASEVQSQIYLEIDRVTDNEARRMLQSELPEMRTILKMLRDNSKAEL